MFQSTPARGGRPLQLRVWAPRHYVSIHARTRRATFRRSTAGADSLFQSTPARGGRQRRTPRCRGWESCFNPRPHAAGDDGVRTISGTLRVSIHARTRRATDAAGDEVAACAVSIHARTRRATFVPAANYSVPRFQSTPARGGRRHGGRRRARPGGVSIHARTRRATLANACLNGAFVFQSTPARGGRHRAHRVVPAPPCVSIHARTRRATVIRCATASWTRSFNPRPHAAGDAVPRGTAAMPQEVSIHARTRRATRPALIYKPAVKVSIHARTRRATAAPRRCWWWQNVSIHARTRRATPARRHAQRTRYVSIHARTRRATRYFVR